MRTQADESAMNLAAVITNLKSNLTRFYAKESVLTGSLLVQENRLDYASGGASLWANFED
jgi:hypothetical protein